ncbi:MAG: DUF1800 domain-containing protein [Acidobacteria bacterium]|nr:MAG: DUF1800 domain-containing protein [Acidobacteriota bacterium]
MRSEFRPLETAVLVCLALAVTCPAAARNGAGQKRPRAPANLELPRTDLGETEMILRVLDRLAFGPRPGDVDEIRRLGLARYLDEQLHPEGKPDPEVEARLKGMESLDLVAWELVGRYPDAGLQRQIAQRQAALAEQKSPEAQRPASPPQKPPDSAGPQRIVQELVAAKLVREIYSRWQLNEVLVDFWLNHFNVFIQKGPERYLMTEYDRDVSPAMLVYLDNSESVDPTPARPMMRPRRAYDGSLARFFPRPGQRPRGLNENYARELLELHTLGVDGGYTQKDVTEVARCFTGWTLLQPQQGGGSIFVEANHDRGEKLVLGHRIPAGGGIEDGLEVLEILARHPATARFLATKLARRFVSDEPPEALVRRLARVYSETDGDIREMVRALVTSPEFFSPRYAGAKFKRPLEFFVSAVRALGAEVEPHPALAGLLQSLGEPPFACLPPTGYADAATEWLSTNQLLRRMNTAVMLASGRAPGITVHLDRLFEGVDSADASALTDRAASALLGRPLPEAERAEVAARVGEAAASAAPRDGAGALRALAAALVLGSPEFQRQ